MSFDKDHQSPDKIVEVRKRTTKVNIAMVIGIIVFFVVAGLAVWQVAKDPPQTSDETVGSP